MKPVQIPSAIPTGFSPIWTYQLKPGFEFAVPDRSESLDAVEYIPAGSVKPSDYFPEHQKLTFTYRGHP
jgi:hypothetical protein